MIEEEKGEERNSEGSWGRWQAAPLETAFTYRQHCTYLAYLGCCGVEGAGAANGEENEISPFEMTAMAHSKHSIDAHRIDFKGKQRWIKLTEAKLLQKTYVKNANNAFLLFPATHSTVCHFQTKDQFFSVRMSTPLPEG